MKMREQRLIGAALVIMSGILIALACSETTPEDRDVTAVLLTLPLGLYMIFADSYVPHRGRVHHSLYSYFLPKRRTQHMDMNIIQSAATEVLVNLSLAVISLAGAYAVYYIRLGASKLKAQTAQIEDESARKVLDNALADVENIATKSVGAMEQTTAKALRDAVKSGAANREDLLALGKQVFNEVKAAIAPEAQKVITDNLGSFDDYLTKCIEDAVLKVKQSDPFITLPEGVLLEGNTVTEEAAPSSKE